MNRAEVCLPPETVKALVKQHYGMKVIALEMVRAVYRVTTPLGLFGFKNADELEDLSSVASCLDYIRRGGFGNMPRFSPALTGDYLIHHENQSYFLEEWMSGEEVPKKSLPYLEKIGCALADFHRAAKGMVPDRRSQRFEWGQRKQRLEIARLHLERWRRELALSPQEREITDFLLYRCRLALDYIRPVSLELLAALYPEAAVLCHGGLHHKNIMIDGEHNIWFIDFETLTYTERVMDLAQLLQYHAVVYNWDRRVVDMFLSAYTSRLDRPVCPEEWNVFLSYIAFPRRFVNRMHRYYDHPERPAVLLLKLQETMAQDTAKESFLREYPPKVRLLF